MTGFIPAPIKPEITVNHLEKIDVRVGVVERVELVPASNKLVKLTVDFGDRRRTVLAGLRRERADPKAEIEGRQALFVVNLPARRLAGEISDDIGYADGDGVNVAARMQEIAPPGGLCVSSRVYLSLIHI